MITIGPWNIMKLTTGKVWIRKDTDPPPRHPGELIGPVAGKYLETSSGRTFDESAFAEVIAKFYAENF